jgi:hypothetical protein
MEENSNLFESLFERGTDFVKTSFELEKLRAVRKISDVISSVLPNTIVFVLFASFMLFFNLGLAIWIGEITGKIFYGFFILAAFYLLLGVIIYLFMHKWLKKIISNFIIKKLLK